MKRKHKKDKLVEVPTKLVKKTETANNLVDDKDEEPSSDEDEEDAELIYEMLDYFKDKDQQGSSTAEVLSSGNDAPSTSSEEAGSGIVSETSKEANEPVPEPKEEKKALIFESIDLDDFEDEADLEQLGLDHLKHALEVRVLKCGGSVKERSVRLFSVRGLSVDKYPKNIVASKKK